MTRTYHKVFNHDMEHIVTVCTQCMMDFISYRFIPLLPMMSSNDALHNWEAGMFSMQKLYEAGVASMPNFDTSWNFLWAVSTATAGSTYTPALTH